MKYTNNNSLIGLENQSSNISSHISPLTQKNHKNQKNNKIIEKTKKLHILTQTLLYLIQLTSLHLTLEDHLINSDIHFLHLCETHKYDPKNSYNNDNDFQQNNKNNNKLLPHLQFTHTPSNQKFIIIHNPDPNNKASGNSIIISPILYKHIGPLYFIPGRLIHATFYFRKHHQLNIINYIYHPLRQLKIITQYYNSTNR
ncbi:hypothetical protein GLOIN_2v1716639 [Rhizophagus irregularis DAOM 181602=DAOM 197198]|uniref:Uncharacterized protein n=1 Tax=Rhizophagus irregularis (strain DAOM 181602 / DAOM 197198 / MUCL 43194) TaxID=747089 RepID=A0A2P4P3V6_RHIID|nr:hypothetical protein GLOIN_2v1716639 [Rhizophagus irregularis DAOM 181602=DAOM 197198]POG60068.1 hypothetical protein GLOIN_2v1716639 [Rhizophagus irregularis DAOM 181602=DAOM 197198]GET52248.1 hypothetical protein GLOIN_2v1716639 [Rhizophagus irregularis DAOM 181602=DAOM 197198]|eukprot:XP_025166934.1 hypothetical protein GLOIN_2v1716639 [Rhizophagus irregularis DAOM 181602=DAOM 197198]